MTQPLKSKLQGMLEVVYPSVDCDFLAEQLLATMGWRPMPTPHQPTRTIGTKPMCC